MVVLDFFLCYRVPFLIKMYCLMLAGYIYLGTHQGDYITTTHNGGITTTPTSSAKLISRL